MYAALWRVLPGPSAVKALLALTLFVTLVAILFLWAFPAVQPMLPFDQITLESEPTSSAAP
ncbi:MULTISPECIES: hypothetical protein [Mumia]|uniref:hypothetical protein n=1 Tax=Mumia TaxID=1546255 RepID=UPI00142228B7|nr:MULTISPECIES: hypothetical protein [unclassified Mumia]QMW65094.1 hypothetical protein H4N58_12790 [Mumia sp. ZJ1417]